jgi:hypothetical protein
LRKIFANSAVNGFQLLIQPLSISVNPDNELIDFY